MYLTLTITRGPGQGGSKTFDSQGGTIGRGSGNDWVLPDPERFLSSHHAAVYCEDHSFFLADTSTNGVFVNGAAEALGSGRVVALNMGDRLVLGEYELSVTHLSLESPAQAGRGSQTGASGLAGIGAGSALLGFAHPGEDILDPLQLLNAAPASPPQSQNPSFSRVAPPMAEPGWDVGLSANPAEMILDPLELLGGAMSNAGQPGHAIPESEPGGRRGRELPEQDHSSLLNDYFAPPQSGPEVIPEDWDLDAPAGREPVEAARRGTAPALPPSAEPELTALLFGNGSGRQPPEALPPSQAVEASPPPAAIPKASPSEPVQPVPPPANSSSEADALGQFLEGAGLDGSLASRLEENGSLRLVGQIFRQFVEGLSEVLVARAQFKSALRLDMTVIAPSGNNPLKFSAGGTEEALEKLLFSRGKGYLGPLDAVREGFQNIKDHDVALISGLRASFSALLHRFDPADVEDRLGKAGLLGLLSSRKAQCWEAYVQEFQDVKRLSDNDFEAFFKDAFAEAYEAQIDRLTDAKR
jgi:type VI secretion system protein